MARRIMLQTGTDDVEILVEALADNEVQLQELVRDNPDLMPVEDLGMTGPLAVIGRETGLPSGSVDLIALSREEGDTSTPTVRRRGGLRELRRHQHLIPSRTRRGTFLLNTQADIYPELRQPNVSDYPPTRSTLAPPLTWRTPTLSIREPKSKYICSRSLCP